MKKLYKRGWERINEMAQKRAQESQIKNKLVQNIVRVILICCLFVIPILPIFLTEEMVANCQWCQSFISFMSSYIPGIKVMAEATKIPQIVSFEVALAWVAIFILSFIMLSVFFANKNFDSDIFGSGKLFAFLYFGIIFFLAVELGLFGSSTSFFYGTRGVYDEDSRHNLVNYLIQSKTGLGFFIFGEIFIEMAIFVSFIMINTILIVKFFKGRLNG